MRKPTFAVAQIGGPTAVMNATLWGFLEGAADCNVLGVLGGPEGLRRGARRALCRGLVSSTDTQALVMGRAARLDPGAWLGAGRYRFMEAELDEIVSELDRSRVDGLALIGGNGTMFVANELHEVARARGAGLSVVGIPKTVDNDLLGTDHAPGFLSAVRFLLQAIADLDRDHRAMRSVEQVRIVETLGRSTGWLACATLAARAATGGAPHLIYLPERSFNEEAFLREVNDHVETAGRAFVVVAEGTGVSAPSPFAYARYDRPISGGVAGSLAALVEERLGYGTRAEVLGLIQRCASHFVLPLDREEATALGREAARLLRGSTSGVMVGLARRQAGDPPLQGGIVEVPLREVAGMTRALPSEWIPDSSGDASDFLAWLMPLLDTSAYRAALVGPATRLRDLPER